VKKIILKKALFRAITLTPLLILLTVVLYFLFLTNLPQLLYSQSIRNIRFDCLDISSASYVYKMKPGKCTNQNIEWSVVYSIDVNGFRNAIRQSSYYDVAVIGDSFANGAGVADDQTFSYLLESSYHYKTVNLGIGSYATMRELEVLSEYGKDAKYVVVQYCNNDLAENEAVLRLSKEDFRSQAEAQARNNSANYYQGKSMGYRKVLHDLAVMLKDRSYSSKSSWRSMNKLGRPMEREASAFAQIVARYRPLLEGKRLIVLEASMWGGNSPKFAATFGSELSKIGWLNYRLLNTADILGYEDYFFLDDHITAGGHRKLAAPIAQEISQWESVDPLLNKN
jgi:hypothetical protein